MSDILHDLAEVAFLESMADNYKQRNPTATDEDVLDYLERFAEFSKHSFDFRTNAEQEK